MREAEMPYRERRTIGAEAEIGGMAERHHAARPMMKCRLAANRARIRISVSTTSP